jgi:nicotinamidase-related amidase
MAESRSAPSQVRDPPLTALLILDMMSTWRFPDAEKVLSGAVAICPAIAALKARCKAAGVPVLYANDNHGHWRSDWRQLMDAARAAGGDGARIAELLAPESEDYFVLKPMHSAFFATPLQLLLQRLGTTRLVLTGVTSDQCVLMTAASARMHGYDVSVPRDAVATQTAERARAAIKYFDEVLRVRTTESAELTLP